MLEIAVIRSALVRQPITDHVAQRIATIQKAHNFNPEAGAKQVRTAPELLKIAYAGFAELLKLAVILGIPIPYDPDGLCPEEHLAIRSARPTFVYFAQVSGTTTWKVGWSNNPWKRVQGLQTGHDGILQLRHQVVGDRNLETAVKYHLRKFKTRDRHKTRGEWVSGVDGQTVNKLVQLLKTQGRVLEPGEIK